MTPEQGKRSFSRTIVVIALSLVSGGSLGAAGVLYTCSPYASYIDRIAKSEWTWGSVSRDRPDSTAECAVSLSKIYLALKEYERKTGRLPVETGVRGFLVGKIDDYLGDPDDLVCPADRSHGLYYGTSEHRASRTYFLTKAVSNQFNGTLPELKSNSPIILCRHHPGVLIILRCDGQVEIAPRGKYDRIGCEFVSDVD